MLAALLKSPQSFTGDPGEKKALKEIKEYTSGRKSVPVPTYFVGPSNSESSPLLEALESPECSADIHCLAGGGLSSIKGLNVAFLDQDHTQVWTLLANAMQPYTCI